MKTSELTGAALDWAVAKCEGVHVSMARGGWFVFDSDAWAEFRNDYNDDKLQAFRPSINWAQGGVIIEREGIGIWTHPWNEWGEPEIVRYAEDKNGDHVQTAPTTLIAAMRCYVASKLGDEVEIPDELKGDE